MKYTIILFLFSLPLFCIGQKKLTDSAILHRATDSFFYYRCKEKCAVKAGDQAHAGYYYSKMRAYQDAAYEAHARWDKHMRDPKQKTHLRYMDPDKYYKCPCN
jgi:hypothetical protein